MAIHIPSKINRQKSLTLYPEGMVLPVYKKNMIRELKMKFWCWFFNFASKIATINHTKLKTTGYKYDYGHAMEKLHAHNPLILP